MIPVVLEEQGPPRVCRSTQECHISRLPSSSSHMLVPASQGYRVVSHTPNCKCTRLGIGILSTVQDQNPGRSNLHRPLRNGANWFQSSMADITDKLRTWISTGVKPPELFVEIFPKSWLVSVTHGSRLGSIFCSLSVYSAVRNISSLHGVHWPPAVHYNVAHASHRNPASNCRH